MILSLSSRSICCSNFSNSLSFSVAAFGALYQVYVVMRKAFILCFITSDNIVRVSISLLFGVGLFMVMTNSLLANWHLRTKFVDDTSALEIIPRNSISLLNFAVSDIHEFADEHNMKLNPKKCKEMLINFLHNPNFSLRPIQIGNNIVERVITYKSLGVILRSDLKWNPHIEYIVMKANKKLYPLRVLRRAGVDQKNLLKVYLHVHSKIGT